MENAAERSERDLGYSSAELKKLGVEIVDAENLILRCTKCEVVWSFKRVADGNLPEGYWRCPKGCNSGVE
jgi:hypothetical protein